MALFVLITTSLAAIAWSLWIRRHTWRCRWETASTCAIALQGLALILVSPPASAILGGTLHELTGQWNLEDCLGHATYVVAACCLVHSALRRLGDDHTFRYLFGLQVLMPASLCLPIMLTAFTFSGASSRYYADLFSAPTGYWLDAYWVVMASILIYLTVYAARALLVLRRNPGNRRVADIYLVATGFGVIAWSARIVTTLTDVNDGTLVWLFACLCAALLALASAYSWLGKVRWFTGV